MEKKARITFSNFSDFTAYRYKRRRMSNWLASLRTMEQIMNHTKAVNSSIDNKIINYNLS